VKVLISREHRFIFLKPTKVAGTTVESILALHCGPGDIVTAAPRYQKIEAFSSVVPDSRIPLRWFRGRAIRTALREKTWPSFVEHATAKQVQEYVPERIWNSYKKLSVVRNPFDRIISWYFWDRKSGASTGKKFEDFVLENPKLISSFRRQTHLHGVDIIDFYFRFESLAEDYEKLISSMESGVSYSSYFGIFHLKKRDRPEGSTPREMFRNFPEGIRLVEKLCAKELERFSYSWDA